MTLSILFLSIGLIGVAIPGLPTTPLVLLASYFATNASPRFNQWIKNTKVNRKYVEPFMANRSMTKQAKVKILSFASSMLLISFIIINNTTIRILLVLLAIAKYTYFHFYIETLNNDK